MAEEETNSTLDSNDSDNSCVLCCKNVDIYSIGECNHPICFECSIRLRVLCKNNDCPMCRQKMRKVYFTISNATYEEVVESYNQDNWVDYTQGIFYCLSSIKHRVDDLFSRICPICPETAWKFKTNEKLELHLLRQHGLMYCSICVNHLKIFRYERRLYTEAELVRHTREGDPDDTSYKGHSVCKFCFKTFFDKDDLYIHLRRDHFRCHLCNEESGAQPFYKNYNDLNAHFRKDHYICEKGDCSTEHLLSVFQTKTQYNDHLAEVHVKKKRTGNLEFKSNQPFETGCGKEYNDCTPSTSSILTRSPKKSGSKAYKIPQISQETRDNFFRQFGSAGIPISNYARSKAKPTVQPNATKSHAVVPDPPSWKIQKQRSASKSYSIPKLSQHARDNFFEQFQSSSAHQPTTSAGRIRKAQIKSKVAPQLPSANGNKQNVLLPSLPKSKPNTLQKQLEPKKHSHQSQLLPNSRGSLFEQFLAEESVQTAPEEPAQSIISFEIVHLRNAERDSNGATCKGNSKKVTWKKLK